VIFLLAQYAMSKLRELKDVTKCYALIVAIVTAGNVVNLLKTINTFKVMVVEQKLSVLGIV
jgi:hypothetical protein